MTNSYLEHPSEEALERFLLHQSGDQEIEVLETHILACENCVTRLESLEIDIADLKASLLHSHESQSSREVNPVRSFWNHWFTVPMLSWAGTACVALAVGLTVMPHSFRRSHPASLNGSGVAAGDLSACRGSDGTDATLATCRGAEITIFPRHRPLDLRLDTTDIPQGLVDVQVVNGDGNQIWLGHTTVRNERARLKLPQISEEGPYFLRFYAPNSGTEHELLREFRFEVR